MDRENFLAIFDDEAPSGSIVYRWYAEFNRGFSPDLEPNHFFLFPYVKKRHLEKRFLLIMHSLEIFESEWKKFFNNWCFSIINICIPEKSNSHIILVKFWIEEVKLTFRYSELNYWMYWMKNNAPSKRENFPEISPLTSSAGCRSHKIT